jgi:hypothetical protein
MWKLKEGHRGANREVPAGTIVYEIRGHDYGLASNDTHATGIEHISVTLKADGDYPFFTVPLEDLEDLIQTGEAQ